MQATGFEYSLFARPVIGGRVSPDRRVDRQVRTLTTPGAPDLPLLVEKDFLP